MEPTSDKVFMKRALQLAEGGMGTVSPNPLVGCVIVSEGKIIGEGSHQAYGGPHAEVNAVNSVKDKDQLIGSTVYVTLEPCSHHGMTPPCSDLLITSKVSRVVIAARDNNPLVNGTGIKKLNSAGIKVEQGLLEDEALRQNKRFNTFFLKKRPYIILKWAQTADGFIARRDYSSKWISNSSSRQLVHKWRTEEDAILVGRNTAHYDNPKLTSRDWQGKDPLRIVIDKDKSLNPTLNLFTDGKRTLVYTIKNSNQKGNVEWIKLTEKDFLSQLLTDLFQRKIQSLIVEGGSATLSQFISKGLWDEARVFIGETSFDDGISAPEIKLDPSSETKILKDRLLIYQNVNN
ncbi:MAG: bifunctional diaminohydroxyphosphoribosylaminopyrimidine deaminase/5-amino-6-(5-phosphoribosylamino)uracil reductase RibD [Bacteroidota bacterium]